MILQVRKGDTWIGGLDKPFVVSWEAIEEALRAMGLELVEHFERDEKPLPFDPSKLQPYSDEWDNVAIVKVQRGQELDVPDRIRWVKLLNRTTQTTSAGAEAGEAAELAADAATRRAAEKRARQARGLAALAIVLMGSSVAYALARRRRR